MIVFNNYLNILQNFKIYITQGIRNKCVISSRLMRRVFGPKRDEVTGKWRRLHKDELYVLYQMLFG